MRDKLKNEEYFKNKIEIISQGIYEYIEWIQNGEVAKERIMPVYQTVVWDYLRVINSKYSLGLNPSELNSDLISAINITYISWINNAWKIAAGKPRGSIFLDQYGLDAYDQMIWMFSLGYLLDIPNNDFQKLVDVIDRDQVKDFLFEFIICAKIKDRKLIAEESYQKYFGVPKTFEKLRQAIVEQDKAKAEILTEQFITKEWYKNHKDCGWYNSHNNPNHDVYFGYWSFETAAVVKIMGLDDSSFRDCQYYPKDLVREVK